MIKCIAARFKAAKQTEMRVHNKVGTEAYQSVQERPGMEERKQSWEQQESRTKK